MKLILKNSLTILISIFVVFLSIGVNVSKMLCSESGQIYIGKEVPNSKQEQELLCIDKQNLLLCCNEEKVHKS